jgi:hypothetical protein
MRFTLILITALSLAFHTVAAQQERLVSPFGEMYPAGSGHFSRDEERAIAVARAKLTDGGHKRLDSFYKVNRKGKEFWILAFVTERLKWGQEGFSNPAMYTVIVTPKWTVSRVMQGWQQ